MSFDNADNVGFHPRGAFCIAEKNRRAFRRFHQNNLPARIARPLDFIVILGGLRFPEQVLERGFQIVRHLFRHLVHSGYLGLFNDRIYLRIFNGTDEHRVRDDATDKLIGILIFRERVGVYNIYIQ